MKEDTNIILAPSILATNFLNLGSQIKEVEKAGAKYLHIDVMDGHFVPNISFGLPILESIKSGKFSTNGDNIEMILDVHLMISNPSLYIEKFLQAGADIINFHIEVDENITSNLRKIGVREKAALTIKPKTEVETLFPYLEEISMALIMTVEPGFGGQKFMPEMLLKIERLANYREKNNLKFNIQVDGGITLENFKDVVNAGANIIVAGSSIFGANNITEAVHKFLLNI
ncbi:MAG: ribulose-phosphate 3-epimerase [Defluviitaleaceae bacterium]|nr:ribulose-phosphate 3-epimerase [Defluviitaleaceae bacterium]